MELGNGSFDVQRLPPGSYTLYAEEQNLAGSLNIKLEDSDLKDIIIAVGPDIPVTVRVAGDSRSNSIKSSLVLQPDPPGAGINPFPLTIAPGGSITVRGLLPWVYRLQPHPSEEVSYIESARVGNIDILEKGLQIGGNSANDVEIKLSLDGGRIDARINHGTVSTKSVTVALVPEPPNRHRLDRFKVAHAETSRQVRFNAVAPGKYKVFAWPDSLAAYWSYPELIQLFDSRSEIVNVDRSSSQSIEVPILGQ